MADGRRRRPSINDVATLAGVSSKTVSNVLHGQIPVTEPTRVRVTNAIAELNYRPDVRARILRNGRSGILTIALPRLDVPYFGELASELVRAAQAHGYTALVDETSGSAGREADLLAGIGPRLADGVIISPQTMSAEQLQQLLASNTHGAPVVLLGEHITLLPVDHVMIDNVAAGMDATRHLLGLGRRRIAAIGLPPGYDDQQEHAELRLRGYRAALAEAGIRYDKRLVRPGGARRPEDGAAAVAQLLDARRPPDAVFCFTDLLALGAVRELAVRGLRVPTDIAIIGVDDIKQTRYSVPTISTIAPDKAALAETGVSLVLRRLHQPDAEPRTVIVEHRLIVRESTELNVSASTS